MANLVKETITTVIAQLVKQGKLTTPNSRDVLTNIFAAMNDSGLDDEINAFKDCYDMRRFPSSLKVAALKTQNDNLDKEVKRLRASAFMEGFTAKQRTLNTFEIGKNEKGFTILIPQSRLAGLILKNSTEDFKLPEIDSELVEELLFENESLRVDLTKAENQIAKLKEEKDLLFCGSVVKDQTLLEVEAELTTAKGLVTGLCARFGLECEMDDVIVTSGVVSEIEHNKMSDMYEEACGMLLRREKMLDEAFQKIDELEKTVTGLKNTADLGLHVSMKMNEENAQLHNGLKDLNQAKEALHLTIKQMIKDRETMAAELETVRDSKAVVLNKNRILSDVNLEISAELATFKMMYEQEVKERENDKFTNSAWQRDLTAEGVESNPGPFTAMIIPGESTIQIYRTQFDEMWYGNQELQGLKEFNLEELSKRQLVFIGQWSFEEQTEITLILESRIQLTATGISSQ